MSPFSTLANNKVMRSTNLQTVGDYINLFYKNNATGNFMCLSGSETILLITEDEEVLNGPKFLFHIPGY